MKFRGIDAGGDWMFGQGVGSYAKDAAALALDIAARLRSWRGGCFFAPTDGVDYTNLLEKGQEKNLETAQGNCIMQTPGVVKLNSLTQSEDRRARTGSLQANVNTVFSRGFNVTIANITGGPPSA